MKRSEVKAIFPEATDEQLQQLMDLNGADINHARAGLEDLQQQLTAAQQEMAEYKAREPEELAAARTKAAELEQELSGLKAQAALRDMREGVARECKVPAHLLTGETEEACKQQAASILEFAKNSGYPALHDGGEPGSSGGMSTRDQFAEWFATQ